MIMNELHKFEGGDTSTVTKTSGLLQLEPAVHTVTPPTWAQARKELFIHKQPAWYLQAARLVSPCPDTPHGSIFSDRLRRKLHQRRADLCAVMAGQDIRLGADERQQQFSSALANFANETTDPLDYLIWTFACLSAPDVCSSAWHDETLDVADPFSESRLQQLFVCVYHELMSMSTAVNLQLLTRFDITQPTRSGDWVTNHPGGLVGFWPRREGVRYFASIPMPTHMYKSEALLSQGIVGIYLAEDVEHYSERAQTFHT